MATEPDTSTEPQPPWAPREPFVSPDGLQKCIEETGKLPRDLLLALVAEIRHRGGDLPTIALEQDGFLKVTVEGDVPARMPQTEPAWRARKSAERAWRRAAALEALALAQEGRRQYEDLALEQRVREAAEQGPDAVLNVLGDPSLRPAIARSARMEHLLEAEGPR